MRPIRSSSVPSRTPRSSRPKPRHFLLALGACVLVSACTSTPSLGEPATSDRPTWGRLHTCQRAAIDALALADAAHEASLPKPSPETPKPDATPGRTGLQAKVFCYERTDSAATCLRTEDRWLLAVLRAQRAGRPTCARGPFRPTEDGPDTDRLCCYSLLYDLKT